MTKHRTAQAVPTLRVQATDFARSSPVYPSAFEIFQPIPRLEYIQFH